MYSFIKSFLVCFVIVLIVNISNNSNNSETNKPSENEILINWLELEDKKVVHFKDENVCWVVIGTKGSTRYNQRYANASVIECNLSLEPTIESKKWLGLDLKQIIYFKEHDICYGIIGTKGSTRYNQRYANFSVVNCELVKNKLVN